MLWVLGVVVTQSALLLVLGPCLQLGIARLIRGTARPAPWYRTVPAFVLRWWARVLLGLFGVVLVISLFGGFDAASHHGSYGYGSSGDGGYDAFGDGFEGANSVPTAVTGPARLLGGGTFDVASQGFSPGLAWGSPPASPCSRSASASSASSSPGSWRASCRPKASRTSPPTPRRATTTDGSSGSPR